MSDKLAQVPVESLAIRADVERFLSEAAKIEIRDQDSSSLAQAVLVKIKTGIKRWKEIWKPHKDRASALLAGLRAAESELLDKATPVMKSLEGKVVGWTLAERKKAEEAQRAREKAEWEARQAEREAAKAAETEAIGFEDFPVQAPEDLPPEPVKPVLEPEVQMRDHWTWELEPDGFEKVPRRFLKLDEGEITRHVTALKDKANIPGIRAFNKPIVAQSPTRRQA